jgi:hypothetical protein
VPVGRLDLERVGALDPVLAVNVRWLSDYKHPRTLLSNEFSEAAMGRLPEVFVRPVTMTEGRRLQRIGRPARDPVKLRRAIVVLMSAQGQSVPDIAPAGLLSGVCAWGDPRIQRYRVQGPEPDIAEIMWNYSSGLEK